VDRRKYIFLSFTFSFYDLFTDQHVRLEHLENRMSSEEKFDFFLQ